MPIIAGRASAAYGAGFGKAPSGSAFEPVGAFDSLATIVVPSGGAGVVTMTGIPDTYQNLQIRVSARVNTGSHTNYMWLRLNNDTDTGAYGMHQFVSFGGATISNGWNGAATFAIVERIAGGIAPANQFGAIIIDITDYKNQNTNKVIKSLGGVEYNTNDTKGSIYYNSNLHTKIQPVNRIDFAQESGSFVENTIISLYGVR